VIEYYERKAFERHSKGISMPQGFSSIRSLAI
jgi:hypothetical protein